MHYRTFALLTALAIAGCSAGTPIAPSPRQFATIARATKLPENPPQRRISQPRPGATGCIKPLRFVSDYNNSVVDVYSRTVLCRVIFHLSHPNGIAVDSLGTLYVTEQGNSDVAIVKPPYSAVSQRLADPDEDPAGVTVCNGFVAVTNLQTNEGLPGSVGIYAGGATQPTSVLQDPNAASEFSPACDPKGNLYTSYAAVSGGGSVNEWRAAKGTPLEFPAIVTGFPSGLAFARGALWVGDQHTPSITVWPSPFTHASRTIVLQGSDDPADFALDLKAQRIFVADALLNEGMVFTLQGSLTATLPGNGGGLAVGVAYWL